MKKEIVTSLIVIAFCGVLLQQALALPKSRFEPLGPAFFPLMVLAFVIGLSVLHIALELLKPRGQAAVGMEPRQAKGPRFDELLPWLAALAFTAYVLLISYTEVSFLLLTFGFVTLLAWGMASFRRKTLLPAIAVAGGLVLLLQGVFVIGLNMLLP